MNERLKILWMAVSSLGPFTLSVAGSDSLAAAQCVNQLGLELSAKGTEPAANALFSPYSIQSALAMTFAGAAGDTRAEMAKVLHYAGAEAELHRSFAALQQALEDIRKSTAARAEDAKKWGGPSEPITLTVANRLFGQQDYEFRDVFLGLLKDTYGAPLQPMAFAGNPSQARLKINGWVEEQTRQRIRDLIPPGGVDRETRLVLVNAISPPAAIWAGPSCSFICPDSKSSRRCSDWARRCALWAC